MNIRSKGIILDNRLVNYPSSGTQYLQSNQLLTCYLPTLFYTPDSDLGRRHRISLRTSHSHVKRNARLAAAPRQGAKKSPSPTETSQIDPVHLQSSRRQSTIRQDTAHHGMYRVTVRIAGDERQDIMLIPNFYSLPRSRLVNSGERARMSSQSSWMS